MQHSHDLPFPCPRPAPARAATETGIPDIVRLVAKANKRKLTPFDHVRSLDAALFKFDGKGLEKFLPHCPLKEGEELVLAPKDLFQRPMLTFRADQLASQGMGINFLQDVVHLRIRSGAVGKNQTVSVVYSSAPQPGDRSGPRSLRI